MSVLKVSVREARQHFRRLLDQVQAGDEVVVLRRGVEVGRLVRPERNPARLPDPNRSSQDREGKRASLASALPPGFRRRFAAISWLSGRPPTFTEARKV